MCVCVFMYWIGWNVFYFFCDEPISCCVSFWFFLFLFFVLTDSLLLCWMVCFTFIEMDAFILSPRVFFFLFSLNCRTNEWKSPLKFNERNISFVSALSLCSNWSELVSGWHVLWMLVCLCVCVCTCADVCLWVCVFLFVCLCSFSCKIFCDCLVMVVGGGGLFLLQLIPFFILVFLHQTMGRSAELLCLVWHAFGTVF